MDLYSITVYRNLEELRKIQDEREVNPFIFGNTKDNIDYCPEICIDIILKSQHKRKGLMCY